MPTPAPSNAPRLLAALGPALLATIAAPAAAQGQAWPAKPLRLIQGFPAGSTVDVLARPVAARLSEQLGQPVVVENRAGATGVIANEFVARAAPDGYTLLAAPSSSLTSTPHLNPALPYSLRDFTAVAQLSAFAYVLVTHPGVPVKTVRDLVAIARAKPGFVSYGSTGTGSGFHLAGELLARLAKLDLLHVPYKGGPPGITDLLGGRIDFMFYSYAVIRPLIDAGKLRMVGTTGARRDPAIPAIPTLAESGVPGYEASGWHGIFVPAAVPRDIVERLNAMVVRLLATPEMREIWAAQGMGITSATPAQLADRLRADHEFYGRLIRDAGIKGGG
ncbi:MAG: Bug family tripartite tricarboxylate transporter substrate binding protein [Pseudomonadota bacterium]|jgi:tripartite-type tricarboxylate transporter receptor subunit TctC